MSDVVLRCPNCGTTQATPGECDACHEDTVRFFCPNHTPGRWLDGPVCAECAARARAGPVDPFPRSTGPSTGTGTGTGTRGTGAGVGSGSRGTTRPGSEWSPPRRETPEMPPIERPRRIPDRRRPERADPGRRDPGDRYGDRYDDDRDDVTWSGEVRDAGSVDRGGLPPGWGGPGFRIEVPGMGRMRGVPIAGMAGCLRGIVKLAVAAAVLFAMATCWFFSDVIVLGAHEGDARDRRARHGDAPSVVPYLARSGVRSVPGAPFG